PPLEKIASLPPSEERDPFVLLVAVEGWQSSPETKHLNAIVDKLGDATIPLYSVTATRPLGEASVLLRRIVHASYSPVPLFTNMMSKEIMREFIDTNKDQGDMAELENALAGFLFGIAALHFKEGYLEAVKYLNEYVTKYTDYLSRMDDSRLAEFLKM